MPQGIRLARELPFVKVVENRLFTDIAFDPKSQAYAAISSFLAPFEIFNEEGDPICEMQGKALHVIFSSVLALVECAEVEVWITTGTDVLEPHATRSCLELVEPGSWRTIDGYEFRQYETALSVESVNLESKGTSSGYKDFIAVGTIVSRGEDLASRGAVRLDPLLFLILAMLMMRV